MNFWLFWDIIQIYLVKKSHFGLCLIGLLVSGYLSVSYLFTILK